MVQWSKIVMKRDPQVERADRFKLQFAIKFRLAKHDDLQQLALFCFKFRLQPQCFQRLDWHRLRFVHAQ
jgi:hypothetical protein